MSTLLLPMNQFQSIEAINQYTIATLSYYRQELDQTHPFTTIINHLIDANQKYHDTFHDELMDYNTAIKTYESNDPNDAASKVQLHQNRVQVLKYLRTYYIYARNLITTDFDRFKNLTFVTNKNQSINAIDLLGILKQGIQTASEFIQFHQYWATYYQHN